MACGGTGQPPCKQTVVKPAANQKSSKKSKNTNLEKIAVKPNLPVENLLAEFLREQLAPNPDDGNNYYIGVVVDVLTQQSKLDFGIFDIFSDSISNLERYYNDQGDKSKEEIKKIIVHIPELFSTSHVSLGNPIFLETKFKINYSGSEPISKNDLVKIVFRNAQSFSDPEIISIHKSNGSNRLINIEHKKNYDIFNESNECRNLLIETNILTGADQNSVIQDSPYAGYKQLFSELKLIFSEQGYELFRLNQGDTSVFLQTFKENFKFSIRMSSNVDGISGISDEKTKGPKFTLENKDGFEQQDYEVGVQISISKNLQNFTARAQQFSEFLIQHMDKYGFQSKTYIVPDEQNSSNPIVINHLIDIAVLPIGDLASFEKYKKRSEELEAGGNSVSQNQNVENIPNSIVTQNIQNTSTTVQPNTNPEQCPVTPPSVREIYINIEDKTKWTRKQDLKYVDYFLNNTETSSKSCPINYIAGPNKGNKSISSTDVPIKKQNLMLSGDLFKKDSSSPFYTFEQLEKENKKFYNITQNALKLQKEQKKAIEINSSYSDEKNNFITKTALNLNLEKLNYFLTAIRTLIANNEFAEIKDGDKRLEKVLVLPINVIRKKPRSGAKFPDSRHYFGLAVDFVVYIKVGEKIYQIPPGIVFLYIRKICALNSDVLRRTGNGVYVNELYNHFEILFTPDYEEKPSSFFKTNKTLTNLEIQNGKVWSDVSLEGLYPFNYDKVFENIFNTSGNDPKIARIRE